MGKSIKNLSSVTIVGLDIAKKECPPKLALKDIDARRFTPGGFFLLRCAFTALISCMGTKTTFICDCCFREADGNLGWAHVSVNGVSDGKQLMPDDNRDLCEMCWSPLQTLIKKVYEEARDKRSSAGDTTSPGK